MNVSGIRPCALNFGKVKKSAAKVAIQKAGEDPVQLNEIKEIVKAQSKNDRYDILSKPEYSNCFIIVKRDEENRGPIIVNSLKKANKIATTLQQQDAKTDKANKNKSTKTKVDKLIDSILNMCEE